MLIAWQRIIYCVAAQHVYLKRRQWKPLWNGTESLKTLYFCRMIGPITCIATMCFVCQTICELCLQLDFSNNSTDMNNKNHAHKKKKYPSRFRSAIAHVTIDAHVQNGRPRSTGTLVRLAKFKSKYERHLKTLSHQAYAQCIFFDE